MKKLLALAFLIIVLASPRLTFARDNVTDWYIKDFQTEFKVNKDSSALITEKITADCGQCVDKHGIFRVLPTQTNTGTKKIPTPITLISITDFNDRPINYATINNRFDKTVTWKIGDANKTVTGINTYKIVYKVDNVVLFSNPDFDEFYWDLNGNYWDLEIDNFKAKVIFPSEVTSSNTKINVYAGLSGENGNNLAKYQWTGPSTLEFTSARGLAAQEGITTSVTFPKQIFTPYKPSFWQMYGNHLFALIPILAFIWCFRLWSRFGKDPKIHHATIPEFEIPENLSPLEMDILLNNGSLKKDSISAAIIGLAVKKIITITEIPKQGVFGHKDYKLTRLTSDTTRLSASEKVLTEKLFGSQTEITLSSLKNKFYTSISGIEIAGRDDLISRGFIAPKGLQLSTTFIVIGIILTFGTVWLGLQTFYLPFIYILLTGILFLVFAPLMKQRTVKGAELLMRIKGFEMYMKTAEKYRQQFNEKENIFERYLPYAALFGITSLWINKMKSIYGEEYMNRYYPAWYIGSPGGSFNVDSFSRTLSGISNSVGSAMASPSGSGGGGFSGGGGGGGGGGGW